MGCPVPGHNLAIIDEPGKILPNGQLGQIAAFIVLNEGYAESDELVQEIQAYVKVRLAAHEYPRQIAFIDNFPLTTTSKIMRRKLRELPTTSHQSPVTGAPVTNLQSPPLLPSEAKPYPISFEPSKN